MFNNNEGRPKIDVFRTYKILTVIVWSSWRHHYDVNFIQLYLGQKNNLLKEKLKYWCNAVVIILPCCRPLNMDVVKTYQYRLNFHHPTSYFPAKTPTQKSRARDVLSWPYFTWWDVEKWSLEYVVNTSWEWRLFIKIETWFLLLNYVFVGNDIFSERINKIH